EQEGQTHCVVTACHQRSTSETRSGERLSSNARVFSRSNRSSRLSIARKNLSRLAFSKFGVLKIEWYGRGRPLRKIMPRPAVNAAERIVSSYMITIQFGQLLSGLPPMTSG